MSLADRFGFGPKREVSRDGDTYIITVTPGQLVGKYPPQQVRLTNDQYRRYLEWQNGKLIQDALPDLMKSQREILMSGLGDADFHEMFKEDD